MKAFFSKLFGWAILIWIVGYLGYLIGYGIDLCKGREFELSGNFLIMTSSLLFLLFSLLSMKYAQRLSEECQSQCEEWYGIHICWRAGVCELLRKYEGKKEGGVSKEYLEEILREWERLISDLAINLQEQNWYIPIGFGNERRKTFEPTSSLKYILHRDLFGEVFASPKVRLRFLKELFPPKEFVEYLCKLEVAEQEKILERFFGDEKVSVEDLK
ncbi:MAG TPA: hypothetical protein IAA23_05340 [Candidatus Helicobacter avistercoris]|nr:hypothetical protein [Candidatus Helicobacter avistercoris]